MSKAQIMPSLRRDFLSVAASISASETQRADIRDRSTALTIRDGDQVSQTGNGLAATTYLLLALTEALLESEAEFPPKARKTLLALKATIRVFLLPKMWSDAVWLDEEGIQEVGVLLDIIGCCNQRLLQLYGVDEASPSSRWPSVELLLDAYSTLEDGDRVLDIASIRGLAA